MGAVLISSVNVFALLESDDPGNTSLADLAAQAKKADTAAKKKPRKFYRRREPEMSPWKKNKLKAEAEAAAKKKMQQQLAASSTKTNTAGRSRRPQQPAVPSRAPVVVTARSARTYRLQVRSRRRLPCHPGRRSAPPPP